MRPIGNALVPYGTPLHVTEILLLILKVTFEGFPEASPYHFCGDDFEKTGILFDVTLNKHSGIWGKKPLVVVSRGTQNSSIVATGDAARLNIPMHSRTGSTLIESSADIKVVSKAKAETEIIGQHIFGTLMMARTILPQLCGVHMVQAVTLSPVSKFEQDDECFMLQASIVYTMQYAWSHTTPVILLDKLQTSITPVKHSVNA